MANATKFQIMSDLHLETHSSYDFDFPKTAPNLALLGDIGHIGNDELFRFLERQLGRFEVVFFLLGNHEPYHLKISFAKHRVLSFATRMEKKHVSGELSVGKFVFLDHTRFDLDDNVSVLGCTLYSRVPPEQARAVQSRLVDFKDILGWDVGDHVDAHLEELAWLNKKVKEIEAAEPNRRIIVFTHHCPTIDDRANNPKYRTSGVRSGFVTDLSNEVCWNSKAVILWGFGHTHFNCDFIDGHGKRVVANQKGYYMFPQSTFIASKVLDIALGGNEGVQVTSEEQY